MILLLLLISLCTLLLYYYWRLSTYWIRKNVPGPKFSFFGNILNASMLKITIGESLQMIYKEYEKYPFVGTYELTTPVLLLRNPKLIKRILVKDFACFNSRRTLINKQINPLSANLVNINGEPWRKLRIKLTPAFTTSNIRQAFELMTEVSEKFKQFVDQYADNDVEFRNLCIKFTCESIATCFFGLKTNTIQNDDSEVLKMSRKALNLSLKIMIMLHIREYMPNIFEWLPVPLIPRDFIAYLTRMVKEITTHRKMNNVTQNDIMQILIDLKYNETKMKDALSQSQNVTSKANDTVVNDKFIAAQVFFLFLAGFEPTSLVMSFTMYELAANPKIQEKLYDEIRTAYEKYGCFSYDTISKMKYLDCVVRETLRKYPTTTVILRVCGESYKIPDSNVVLEKGTKVLMPIYAIHHDPLYYKNPNVFDPDRFIDENKKLFDNDAYLPFGNGPRKCIGVKLAYILIKIGLVTLMANYKVELSEKTTIPLKFEPYNLSLTPKSIWLKIHRRL